MLIEFLPGSLVFSLLMSVLFHWLFRESSPYEFWDEINEHISEFGALRNVVYADEKDVV
jgi:hypothetical protein